MNEEQYESEEHEAAEGEGEASRMSAADLEALGKKWMDRIKAAEEREERWCRDAEAATKAYTGDSDAGAGGKTYDFNIFHSNIETIAPSVYNSTPRPDIRERWRSGDETPETAASRVAAQILERAILMQIDDGALDPEIEMEIQDALVSGRGVLRLRFDADEEQVAPPPMQVQGIDPMTGAPVVQLVDQPAQTVITGERITFEAVSWRDYREGPAKRWEDVPWVAYRHCIPQEEVDRIRDEELREALGAGDESAVPSGADEDAEIWEIWCKTSGKVYMIVAHSAEVLSITDDPLGLPSFFPQGRPIQPIMQSGKRTPIVPFSVYRALCDELETITNRIRKITDGLKVRGFYAGDAGAMSILSTAGDNELVPIANLEGIAQTGGLDSAISWWPLDKAIQVLQQLYVSREATKNMIYEITGISDIVRGQGKASETATAQEIKNQWGSLRIRKLQRMVEYHIRELFVICAQVVCTKFSPDTLGKISGVQITPEIAQILGQPLDMYRIDVESDSTVRADLTRRKGEMGEFLQGTAAFFQTMTPIIQASPALAGPVSQMYSSFARQFNLGQQAEDAIEDLARMGQSQAKDGAGAQQKAQQQAAEAQAKADAREDAKLKADVDSKMAQVQISQGQLQIDAARLKLEERKVANEEKKVILSEKTAEIGALAQLNGDFGQ